MSQRAEDFNPPTQDTAYTFQSTSLSRLQIKVRTRMRKFMCVTVEYWEKKIHIRAQSKVWTRQFAHVLQWFLTCVTVPIYFRARLGPNFFFFFFLNDCLLWCQMGNGCFLKGVVSQDNHKDVCEGVFPVLEFFFYWKHSRLHLTHRHVVNPSPAARIEQQEKQHFRTAHRSSFISWQVSFVFILLVL